MAVADTTAPQQDWVDTAAGAIPVAGSTTDLAAKVADSYSLPGLGGTHLA